MKKILFGLCLMLAACGKQPTQHVELNCPEISGVDALLDKDGVELIVFGEFHGMEGPPQFVTDVLCHDIKLNGRSVLALEYSKDMQADIDAYLLEANEDIAIKKILRTKAWSEGMQDGRRSRAMLGAITAVKTYKMKGYDASVALFISGSEGAAHNDESLSIAERAQRHEKDMANNILNIVAKNKASGKKGHVLVLVGNVHARRGVGRYTDPPYDLLAKLLPINSVLTLNNNYSAGTSWNCLGGVMDKDFDCSAHNHSGYVTDVFKDNGAPITERALHLLGKNVKGYDGYFYIGTSIASLPAYTLLED